jgi:hypothetical protein
MRLLYVVQRYGPSIAGGAEQHCREIAERMSARGHEVQVATTCAESYVDWANVYPRGVSDVNGIAYIDSGVGAAPEPGLLGIGPAREGQPNDSADRGAARVDAHARSPRSRAPPLVAPARP